MPRAAITQGAYPSGRRFWKVEAFVAGRRIRRYFIDRDAAEAKRDEIENSSAEALLIPEFVRFEAWDCHRRLTQHGWSLTKATNYVLQHVIRFENQLPVCKLVEKYLAEQAASGVVVETLRDLRSRLTKFARRFGDRQPHTITADDIKGWHNEMMTVEGLAAQSRCHYLTKASQFFRWSVANKYCEENPLVVVKRPKVVRNEIAFYDVGQCQRLLDVAPRYSLQHYLVLGLFAGIRPTELRRLHGDFVRLDRRIVILSAQITKKNRRRFIEMPVGDTFGETLFAWLTVMPLSGPVFQGSHSTFVRRFRDFRDALGFKWIQDGLRHSAATYHFAYYNDAAKTAALLGERDITTLLQHYKGLATRSEAEQFYALRLGTVSGDSTAIGIRGATSSGKE